MVPASKPGRVAGVDYGTVRIGIALTDDRRTIASPYETWRRQGPDQDARRFRRLVEEEDVARFVVGLPVHLDGRESQKSAEARRFARWLEEVTGVETVLFDERFTTAQAEELLLAGELTSKRRKARRDMLAAQILLTAYLEAEGKAGTEPGGLDDENP